MALPRALCAIHMPYQARPWTCALTSALITRVPLTRKEYTTTRKCFSQGQHENHTTVARWNPYLTEIVAVCHELSAVGDFKHYIKFRHLQTRRISRSWRSDRASPLLMSATVPISTFQAPTLPLFFSRISSDGRFTITGRPNIEFCQAWWRALWVVS